MLENEQVVLHPGAYLKQEIDKLSMSQNEFALRVGMSAKNLNTLINAKSDITYDIACKLGSFFNNDVSFWTNLQNEYYSYLKTEEYNHQLEREWKIVLLFDKDFIRKYCQIKISNAHKQKTIEDLRKCLLVSNLENLKNKDLYPYNNDNSQVSEKEIILRNAWISLAINLSKDINVPEFKMSKLIHSLDSIKNLSLLELEVFKPRLNNIFVDIGIKYIELPYLKNSNICSFSKWNKNTNNYILAVNDHGQYADRVWYNIFNEIGHIINNNRKYVYIGSDDDKDEFALNVLLNKKRYSDFVKKGVFTMISIRQFSRSQQVHRNIIIGRLQRDGHIKNDNVKKRYRVKKKKIKQL